MYTFSIQGGASFFYLRVGQADHLIKKRSFTLYRPVRACIGYRTFLFDYRTRQAGLSHKKRGSVQGMVSPFFFLRTGQAATRKKMETPYPVPL